MYDMQCAHDVELNWSEVKSGKVGGGITCLGGGGLEVRLGWVG
jgi:hypothetical protein